MKAAVFRGAGQPLEIVDVEVPKVGYGEVLVKVAACGVCATDLHYLHGVPTFKKPPIILGHEISGTVAEVGEGVIGFSVGEPVLVPPVLSCGVCPKCFEGRDNICENMQMVGNHVDGGFAEYVKAPARNLIHLRESLPLRESSIISDAVSTPYHAVKNRGDVRGGEWVAVIGCGGVGINAVQIASALGGLVIAVDIDDRKLQLAKQLGAVETINPKEADVGKTVQKIAGGGVDVAFEVVGKPATLEQALSAVKPGGRLVVVGYSAENWSMRVSRLMFREISVVGSLGCRLAEYPAIINMVKAGKIKLEPVISDRLGLEEVNTALKRLEEGKAVGRQIVVMS
ncbi:MAG: zinc-binding dehydrogenase [Candidatus Caldarchaeum sp.]